MAETLEGNIEMRAQVEHVKTGDLSDPTETVIRAANFPKWTVATGTGAEQADLIFSDTRQLGIGASEDLDLTNLTDSFGTALNFARIKYIQIKAATGNGSTITIGGAAADPWLGFLSGATHTVKLRAKGAMAFLDSDVTGMVVGAGNDTLKILNDDGAAVANYDIVIVGASV